MRAEVGNPYCKNGCINFVFDTLTRSTEFINLNQYPEIMQRILTRDLSPWHVSQLLKALLAEGRISRLEDAIVSDPAESQATLFIVQKDWNTVNRAKTAFHLGLIFYNSPEREYEIIHNRKSIILPDELKEKTGVISHRVSPESFRKLTRLWNSSRKVESYGGGIINYAAYY